MEGINFKISLIYQILFCFSLIINYWVLSIHLTRMYTQRYSHQEKWHQQFWFRLHNLGPGLLFRKYSKLYLWRIFWWYWIFGRCQKHPGAMFLFLGGWGRGRVVHLLTESGGKSLWNQNWTKCIPEHDRCGRLHVKTFLATVNILLPRGGC